MARREPLPAALTATAFAVGDGYRLGLSRQQLRHASLVAPYRGVRRVAAASQVDLREALVQQCVDYAPLLRPADRFSHLSAAALLGLPLPLDAAIGPIHVTATQPHNPVRARNVVGHRSKDSLRVLTRGLPVSSPSAVFLELAATLTLPDLVAIGDALVLEPRLAGGSRGPAFVPPVALMQEVTSWHGRGAARAREVVALVRERVESPMETRLRLLIRAAGLPEPEVGIEVRDPDGRFLAFADLMFPELRLIVEYDGDQHRYDPRQYEHDQARVQSLFRADFDVIRVRRQGLLRQPHTTQALIRDAYRGAVARRDVSSG